MLSPTQQFGTKTLAQRAALNARYYSSADDTAVNTALVFLNDGIQLGAYNKLNVVNKLCQIGSVVQMFAGIMFMFVEKPGQKYGLLMKGKRGAMATENAIGTNP
jgi:hypothetical protein